MMRPVLAGSLLLSLAACGNEAPPPPEQGPVGGARGEVLEGTISDAMLPLDTIVQPAPAQGTAGEEADGPDDEAAQDRPPAREQSPPQSGPPAEAEPAATPEDAPQDDSGADDEADDPA